MLPRTVKGISGLNQKSDLTDAFVQQISQRRLRAGRFPPSTHRYGVVDDWFTTSRLSPFPPCSGCDIVIPWCGGGAASGRRAGERLK